MRHFCNKSQTLARPARASYSRYTTVSRGHARETFLFPLLPLRRSRERRRAWRWQCWLSLWAVAAHSCVTTAQRGQAHKRGKKEGCRKGQRTPTAAQAQAVEGGYIKINQSSEEVRSLANMKYNRTLMRLLFRKDAYAFFLTPVDVTQVPGYTDIIKRPMDFGTISNKVSRGKYRTLEDFAVSLMHTLLPSNASSKPMLHLSLTCAS